MKTVFFDSAPRSAADSTVRETNQWRPSGVLTLASAISLLVALAAMAGLTATVMYGQGLSAHAAITLCIFVGAVWFWIFTKVEDTYVALGAAVALVISGTLPTQSLFHALGEESVWLLMAAFVIASAVASTGLAARGAAFVITGARNVRQLAHLTSLGLIVTAFAIPATSGRAALALPIFLALRGSLRDRPNVAKMLSILFPTVILLSAVSSFLGAGAHLITSQVLESAGLRGFDFASWLLLGLPLAIVTSGLATELVLRLFTSKSDQSLGLRVSISQLQAQSPARLQGPLDLDEHRSLLLLGAVVVLWCTEPIHGLEPALVALIGALVVSSPYYGSVKLGAALKKVPWSMLIFMAATLALGSSLVTSGAAHWLASSLLGPVEFLGPAKPVIFVVAVVAISTLAHLVIQSRSARSAVLIPIVVASAGAMGVDPVAAAFASTAAAGFCHTLTSSAKPVALFAETDGQANYEPRDLLRLSLWLGPANAAVVLLFSFFVWPLMGLPLFPSH
jgi:sodium-dependent dicarboxylate transporter 2/3/5